MALDIYWIALLLLLPTVVFVSNRALILKPFQRFRKEKHDAQEQLEPEGRRLRNEDGRKFRRMFLEVYLLVMGSEWLQSPHLYALLRDEKKLDESTVASMYVTAYTAAAMSALGTGFLADRYGRRLACLVFCGIHTISCFTVLSDNLAVLFAGRALAGVSLTLLWTVFESWMVTEYNARGLHQSSISLTRMFGLMTTSNCMGAVLGGVVGHCIVLVIGSRTIPFVAGVVLELTAVLLIIRNWNENFGQPAEAEECLQQAEKKSLLGDKKLWIISFISCCFEGTNFLVLFFWPGILQDAHRTANPNEPDGAPYGVIFATFMAAMILGAQFFNTVVQDEMYAAGHKSRLPAPLLKLVESSNLLGLAVVVAGGSLLLTVFITHEIGILCAFLAFEVCNGIYVPCIAYQRGIVVNETNRAGLYGLMKLPLFIFVIAALLTAVEDHNHRRIVFVACFVALFIASIASFIGLRNHAGSDQVPGTDLENPVFELVVEDYDEEGNDEGDEESVSEVELSKGYAKVRTSD